MSKITAFQSISLDGVMQAPGRPDEDSRGGFTQGGWGQGFQDQVSMEFASEGMSEEGALLFGRRTYQDLLAFWTTTAGPNPFAEVLLNSPKYVASRSAESRLQYPASTLLSGDVVEEVRTLTRTSEVPLTIMGSGELFRTLHAAGLIDEYVLLIHPIVLGSGTRLFGEGERTDLTLVRSIPTTTGVIITQYRRP